MAEGLVLHLDKRKEHFVEQLIKWGKANVRDFPWRSTSSPVEIIIAEIFLQRTPAERVASRYSDLIRAFGTHKTSFDETSLTEQFRDLGLTKRIGWLIRLLEAIDTQFEGVVPNHTRPLLSLPGVGLYTANAILCFAFNERVPIVDTNVVRIISRVFNIVPAKPLSVHGDVYRIATSLVPERNPKLYNFSLLDFGALICTRTPNCSTCPMKSFCCYNPCSPKGH